MSTIWHWFENNGFRLFDKMAEAQHVTFPRRKLGDRHKVDVNYTEHKNAILTWPTSSVADTKNLIPPCNGPKQTPPNATNNPDGKKESDNPANDGDNKENDKQSENDKKDDAKQDKNNNPANDGDKENDKQTENDKKDDAKKDKSNNNNGKPRCFLNDSFHVAELLQSGEHVPVSDDKLERLDSGQLVKVDGVALYNRSRQHC